MLATETRAAPPRPDCTAGSYALELISNPSFPHRSISKSRQAGGFLTSLPLPYINHYIEAIEFVGALRPKDGLELNKVRRMVVNTSGCVF